MHRGTRMKKKRNNRSLAALQDLDRLHSHTTFSLRSSQRSLSASTLAPMQLALHLFFPTFYLVQIPVRFRRPFKAVQQSLVGAWDPHLESVSHDGILVVS